MVCTKPAVGWQVQRVQGFGSLSGSEAVPIGITRAVFEVASPETAGRASQPAVITPGSNQLVVVAGGADHRVQPAPVATPYRHLGAGEISGVCRAVGKQIHQPQASVPETLRKSDTASYGGVIVMLIRL